MNKCNAFLALLSLYIYLMDGTGNIAGASLPGAAASKYMDLNVNRDREQIAQAISQLLEKIRRLHRSISEAPNSDADNWFRNLILGILGSALHDYQSVEIGARNSIYLLAWGRRNLLELKVITKYILASGSNADDFKNELVTDAKEFYQAIAKLTEVSYKKLMTMLSDMAEREEIPINEVLEKAFVKEPEIDMQADASESESKIYKQLAQDFGLRENFIPKRMSQIARLMNEDEDFEPMFKICSKIMHRSVLSIASSNTPGSLDEAIPFLFNSSISDLFSIYESIRKHFEEHGIRAPQN